LFLWCGHCGWQLWARKGKCVNWWKTALVPCVCNMKWNTGSMTKRPNGKTQENLSLWPSAFHSCLYEPVTAYGNLTWETRNRSTICAPHFQGTKYCHIWYTELFHNHTIISHKYSSSSLF
jgi:hypothetical protein